MALPAQRGFVRAEPVFIYPSLGVGIGYDDNLTSVRDNRISSAFVMLFPRVRADIKKGSDTYAVTYNGRYGHYFRDSDNDINEHEVVATSNNQFTARADLAATETPEPRTTSGLSRTRITSPSGLMVSDSLILSW